jgi:hypothetical protein
MKRVDVQHAVIAGAMVAVGSGLMSTRAQGVAALGQTTGAAKEPAVITAGPIEREVRSGAVTLVVRVARGEVRVGERFEVEVEARTDRDHDLEMAAAPASMGELRVVSVRDEAPRRKGDGTLVLVRRLTLEPFLDGEYTIPAVGVTCTALEEAGKAMTVSTEALTVRVVSNLTEAERGEAGKVDVGEARTILPVPEEPGRSWLWVGAAGVMVGAVGAALGGWMATRRRGRGLSVLEAALPRIRVIRAGVEAERASRADLDELVALTRQCLVERCDARAAGMTTEELRRAAVEWPMLAAGEAGRLVDALAACDAARFGGVESTRGLSDAAGAIEEVMERLRYAAMLKKDAAGGVEAGGDTRPTRLSGGSETRGGVSRD